MTETRTGIKSNVTNGWLSLNNYESMLRPALHYITASDENCSAQMSFEFVPEAPAAVWLVYRRSNAPSAWKLSDVGTDNSRRISKTTNNAQQKARLAKKCHTTCPERFKRSHVKATHVTTHRDNVTRQMARRVPPQEVWRTDCHWTIISSGSPTSTQTWLLKCPMTSDLISKQGTDHADYPTNSSLENFPKCVYMR